MSHEHDPEREALQLAEKLAPRKRHVIFLVGAGASCAAGLHDTPGLQRAVAESLESEERTSFDRLSQNRNLEEVLSRLRLLAEVLTDDSAELDGFTAETASRLDQRICSEIARLLISTDSNTDAHQRFATAIGYSRSDWPIEIFTLNYDLLIEQGLEIAGVPFFDGFVGSYEARFRPDLVDSTGSQDAVQPPSGWVRVWKLHGSISWRQIRSNDTDTIVRSSQVQPHEMSASEY